MLALEVEYLTGRAVATERNDRDVAEWPPHPGRLFSALVAAYVERDPGDTGEREALLWLEAQRPPEISATAATRRDVLTVFVPVNDTVGPQVVPKKGFTPGIIAEKIRVLPERRGKQPRTFPSVTPDTPRVVFAWPDVDPAEADPHRAALGRLAANVTYLGHSSSLVRVALCADPPPPTLRPHDEGTHVLRVPTPGRLADLLATFETGRRPSAGFFCGYAAVDPEGESAGPPSVSTLGSPVVFSLEKGSRIPLAATVKVTAAVRAALLSLADQPPREVLSGHTPEGMPSGRDHVSILPLAFVGHRRADGDLKGFAVTIPREARGDGRRHILRALGRLQRLELGPEGCWTVERVVGEPSLASLSLDLYEEPAMDWATVTPMIFDRFPKARPGHDARGLITRACRRIGLPDPVRVEVSHVSRILGVPPSGAFRIPPRPGIPSRPYQHVSIGFDRPVRGPIALGAGRYLGIGLFRSFDRSSDDRRRP